jgi:neutral ceramidase
MRFLKIFLKICLGLLLTLIVLLACMVAPVDDTPYQQMDYYKNWKTQLKTLTPNAPISNGTLKTGWAKVNFTPTYATPMAGYGVRQGKHFESVHDSVFVRALILDNGSTRTAIVSADLLIIPPAVTTILQQQLSKTAIPFERVFLGATHSHNSVGGWSDSVTGELFGGKYNAANVTLIANAIIKAITDAQKNLIASQISYQQVADTTHVYNRFIDNGAEDPFLRTIRLIRSDGSSALLCSYAAHSTVLSSDNMALSRDYSGFLVDSLEKNTATFALFMAGAVGSMGPKEEGGKTDLDNAKRQADALETDIEAMQWPLFSQNSRPLSLQSFTAALPLREPNPRIAQGWRLRPWVFRWAFGDYPAYVKVLRIGDVLMIGLPCDFSGEFMKSLTFYAQQKNLKLMVTSFNGGYIGYITPDEYYSNSGYETLTMNWFGPQNGAYFQEIIRDLIDMQP